MAGAVRPVPVGARTAAAALARVALARAALARAARLGGHSAAGNPRGVVRADPTRRSGPRRRSRWRGTRSSTGAPKAPLADPRRGCHLPRFFLNVRRHGTLIADREGDDLPDRTAAEHLARDILREMRRLPHVYGAPRGWRADTFVITDEAGAVVAEVPYASVL
ncbi:hypothetical protein [Methylobacterium sp. Leaf361]|uniref:DUF6894 family protein n=1 Tax=Methylobacterium sp. Leaf361 TaxID=1736352 RepID=UPI000B0C58F9|nr:hypothetical protein [Methylobacterium sp. Leaf361]